jgi:autophagy-related protein 9
MSRSGGFLDTLNPIAKSRHNQLQNLHNFEQTSSLLEEDEDADSFHGDGQNIPMRASNALLSPKSRNIATLDADARGKEALSASEGSDEEVPQSFMIETSPATRRKAASPHIRDQRRGPSQKAIRRGKRSAGGATLLPTTHPIHKSTHIPHPGDIEEEEEDGDNVAPLGPPRVPASRRRKGKGRAGYSDNGKQDASKRGLDEYQQALWRWVNVYNLDEYLQEVCIDFAIRLASY